MSTVTLVKKDLILGGLACAHCAEEIGEAVKKIKGIENSNMNFVNKKLTLQIDANYNEKEIIKEVIKKIDSIEPGLDIQVGGSERHNIDLNLNVNTSNHTKTRNRKNKEKEIKIIIK